MESEGGKWAKEVYDLLRLFGKVKNSIYGLVLLEIGWTLLLLLVARLTPVGDPPITPTITVPWLTIAGFISVGVNVVDLFIPGAILLAIVWVFWSGLYAFIYFPLRWPLRMVALVMVLLFVFVMALLNWLIFPITISLERRKVDNWIKTKAEDEIKKIKEDLLQRKLKRVEFLELLKDKLGLVREVGLENYEQLYKEGGLSDEEKTKLRKNIQERAFREYALEQTGFSRLIIMDRIKPYTSAAIAELASRAYVGLATLQSYSYTEDLSAAKAPSQVLSTAIQRLRWKLEHTKSLRYVQFDYLPEHLIPRNSGQAAFLRRILWLDTLLWGSYLPGDSDKIWLNIERKTDSESSQNQDESQQVSDLFPLLLRLPYYTLVIDQRNPWDAYVLLIIVLIQTLKTHSRENKPIDWSTLDILYFNSEEIEKMVYELIFDAFQNFPKSFEDSAIYPVPANILVEIAGNWVGLQFRRQETEYGDIDSFAKRLYPIISRCIELEPTGVENYYRQGALECLLGNVDDAVAVFEKAKLFEKPGLSASYHSARADIYLANLDSYHHNDLPLAMYVANAARVINLGNKSAKQEIKERITPTTGQPRKYFMWRELDQLKNPDFKDPPTYQVLLKLLEVSYGTGQTGGEQGEPLARED